MYRNIYFIGIGGIGMSAIARYYNTKGYSVSGYDKTPSDLTRELEAEGISIHYEERPDLVPQSTEDTLVIYTPAIPADMTELVMVREKGYKLLKRSRMLGEISKDQTCLAVAGTHGKTSTSTMLAHIYTDSKIGCSAFLGGISKNYNSNLLISENKVVVAEADEFDRSFLQLFPKTAVITAMDADHLDIYGNIESVHAAFRDFAAQVSDTLIIKKGLPISEKDTKARIYSYSYDDCTADFYSQNRKINSENGCFTYDLVYPAGVIEEITCGTPGWVNVENSIAAAAIALSEGVPAEQVKAAIGSFRGVKRRFDLHFCCEKCVYLDDYAHHPKELSSAISSIRNIYPGRKICGIFQPHLYTRTRDFADEFAQSLSMLDKLILLDIYPAREEPIPGVSSEIIFDKVTAADKVLIRKEELMEVLEKEEPDVLVSFGAGNIDRYIEPITQMLRARFA